MQMGASEIKNSQNAHSKLIQGLFIATYSHNWKNYVLHTIEFLSEFG